MSVQYCSSQGVVTSHYGKNHSASLFDRATAIFIVEARPGYFACSSKKKVNVEGRVGYAEFTIPTRFALFTVRFPRVEGGRGVFKDVAPRSRRPELGDSQLRGV